MDNEQLTSNLGELIKNQIEICEKLDKIGKQIKKIGKPKKESKGECSIAAKYLSHQFIDELTPFTGKQFAYAMNGLKFKQSGVFAKGSDQKSPFVCAGESIISPKQVKQPDQTETEINQCIKEINKSVDELKKYDTKHKVKAKEEPYLIRCAINEIKSFNDPIFAQANELVDKFMPLVNKWKSEHNVILGEKESYSGVWSYSVPNQRKAAIRCAIMNCDIIRAKAITASEICGLNDLKSELQKMLSE